MANHSARMFYCRRFYVRNNRKIMYQTELQLSIAKSRQKSHEFRKDRRDNKEKKKDKKKMKKEKKRGKDDKNYNNDNDVTKNSNRKDDITSQINAVQQQIKNQQNEYNTNLLVNKSKLQTTLDELLSAKQDYLKTIDHTEYLLDDAKEDTAKYKAMVDGMEEVETYMKKREGALWSRVNVLEGKIGRESRREAEEWYVLCLFVIFSLCALLWV